MRQALLNALLDLDKNDHQVAPEADHDDRLVGNALQGPSTPPLAGLTILQHITYLDQVATNHYEQATRNIA